MYRKDRKKEFFTMKARNQGYPARSVYKLEEIDERYNIFKRNDVVLDLGCAPGSWLMYILSKVEQNGLVVGVDTNDVNIKNERIKSNIVFIKKDINDISIDELRDISSEYDVVVSDLAPATTGIKLVDAKRSSELYLKALDIAKQILIINGIFVCKIFEGELTGDFMNLLKKDFNFVREFRPKAVFKKSKEIYIIAKGFFK